MNSLLRRLRALEGGAALAREDRSEVRRRMKVILDRISRLRRGGADPSEDPEVASVLLAVKRRRGEGGS